MPTLKLALPKGSLQEATFKLFRMAGFQFAVPDRSYVVAGDDPEIEAILFRPQEMAHYMERGKFDAGLMGHDWVVESGADVHEVTELVYSKASMRPVRWVLAVPEESPVRSVKDLQGKQIATEVVNLTRKYLERHGVMAEVEFSWGATEVKARDFADAIVDATETGSSLRANKLRIVDTILESTTRLVANHAAWADPWKREKLQNIALLLHSAIDAHGKVGLKLNAPASAQAEICSLLPSLTSPTISHLSDPSWIAIETIIAESDVKRLVPAMRKAGARGIIEYPLNKIID